MQITTVLGLIVGIAVTAILEHRNTALRTPQDVWAFTQLPTLATIGMYHDPNDPKYATHMHMAKKHLAEEEIGDRAAEHV